MSLNIITVTLNMGESGGHFQMPFRERVRGSGKYNIHFLGFGVGSQYKALGSICDTGRKGYVSYSAVVLL